MTTNESPAALLPCSCGKQAHVVTRDVEPQNDPWYGKRMETFVLCECGMCLFDGGFHDGFSSEAAAAEAWNRRASTAPAASESRGSVPHDFVSDKGGEWCAVCGHSCIGHEEAPTPPAVSNGEPTAEHWKQALRDCVGPGERSIAYVERRANELLARSAAAKGEV